MKTIHVGGINPINRVKTLHDAIAKARDDDTIELHKDIHIGDDKNSQVININKNIIIHGNHHSLSVAQGRVGIRVNTPLEISQLTFQVETRANAMIINADVTMDEIITKLNGPIREFYPIIQVNSQYDKDNNLIRKTSVTVSNSTLLLFYANNNTISEFTDTTFKSYYDGDIVLSSREDTSKLHGKVTINGGVLRSIDLYGNGVIDHAAISKFVDIHGHYDIFDSDFNIPKEDVKAKAYKKEPSSGPLSNQLDSRYALALQNQSEVSLNNYHVSQSNDDYFGIVAYGTNVTIENVNNDTQLLKHVIRHSTVSYKDTHDQNYWDLSDTTTAYVRSTVNSNNEHITAKEKLDEMIGQQAVKDQVNSIMNTIEMNRKTDNKDFEFSYNMIFAGNPGTGKSTIARIVAEALFEIGAIPQNKFTQSTSDEFVKGFVGQTGSNTRKILDNALGGVLFIDEAYELTVKDNTNSFNSEVISVLIRYMEEHRSDLVVIAAGYNQEMKEFLSSNVGLTRRFQWIQFEDYSNDEMGKIFESMRHSFNDEYETPELQQLIVPLFDRLTQTNLSIPDAKGRVNNGGNGGLVRNVYQQIVQARNNRVTNNGGTAKFTQNDIVVGFKVEINKALQRRL